MENVLHKKAKRRKQKQCMEKLRRDKIKRSVEELALLIPEARKQMALGHRLKQSKILQLVVDYVRSSQQENKNSKQWDDSVTAPQHGCQCAYCQQQFDTCAQDIVPSDANNLELSPDSQQNRNLPSPVEYPQYSSPLDTKEYNYNPQPTETPFKENDISESFIQESFPESYRKLSSKSNMASLQADQEQPREIVAMETSDTPPLRALKSLCCSIFAENVPASNDNLTKEAYLKYAERNTVQFDSDFEEAKSVRLIPVTTLAIPDVPRAPFGSESPPLWRPWVYERKR